MGYLLNQEKIEKLRQEISENIRLKALWDNMYDRTMNFTKTPRLSRQDDTIKWWHLIWDRLGDAAFVCAVMPNKQLETYVHDVVMDVCNKDADQWLGPWFRERPADKVATLETAHVGISVAVAYDLCQYLFNDNEKEAIFLALKENCQILCRKFLERMERRMNNWYIVILNGYATVSCVLNDRDAVKGSIGIYKELIKMYNSDSYGESLHYSDYASKHLCHTYEMVVSYDNSLANEFDCNVYGNLMRWYAASFMYIKPLYGQWGETPYPRSLNFGDSPAIFRASGDLLMHISARLKNTAPINAGLAKWLFDTFYANPKDGSHDGKTFGFTNNYHYLSVMLFTQSANAISPKEANIPLLSFFETGTIVLRDHWENPKLILGVQGGYKGNNVTAHRHLDQNSFILSYMNERMIIDPGHCCYRLYSHQHSISNKAHSTWIFETESGEILQQKPVEGNYKSGVEMPMNILNVAAKKDDVAVISSNCALAYGNSILSAQRSWITFGSNVVFIVDRIKSKIPIKATTNFVVNNRNNGANERIFPGNRVVIRRNGIGMKILPLYAENVNQTFKPSWGFANDCYHPEPNNIGQGKEGSTLIYQFITDKCQCEHTNVYAIILDREENITSWHARSSGNCYHVDLPDHKGVFAIKTVDDNLIEIADLVNNKTYNLSAKGLTPKE